MCNTTIRSKIKHDAKDLGEVMPDSSEEETPEQEIEDLRNRVAIKLMQQISSDPITAAALVEALTNIQFAIPMDNGSTKRCGIDFMNIEIPKRARVRRRKGKGKRKRSSNPRRSPRDPGSCCGVADGGGGD